MENKVRSICHGMLEKFSITQAKHDKEIKQFLVMVESCNARVQQVNLALEREYKLKEVIADLKAKI